MLNMKSISETLAALGSVALVVGCGGAAKESVTATEVTAQPEATKAPEAPAEATAGDAAASAEATAPAAPEAKPEAPPAAPIPPRAGSTPVPTVDEWNAETKQVTVKGSTALGCETKMVREYLRISCKGKNDTGGTPIAATAESGAPEAYFFAKDGVVSVVLPYVSGVDAKIAFAWSDKTHGLQVKWPKGAPKPPQLADFGTARPAEKATAAKTPAATPAATPAKSATPATPATPAKPGGAPTATKKDGKKAGAAADCGEGTCA